MGVKTDVDYRAFISRFKDDHNPDTKDYKYDAEDRKDENWRSYNRVVSVLESHSNLVAKLFNAESSRELTIQVFHQLIDGEQKKDIEERTLGSAENISPNEMSNYPCDGIVSSSNPLGVCYKNLSFFLTEITSTVNNTVAQGGNGRKVTGMLKYNNRDVNEKQILDLFYCTYVDNEAMLTLNANTAFAYLMNMLAAKSFVSHDWTACFSDKLLKQSTSAPVNHNDLKVAKNKAMTTLPVGSKSIDNPDNIIIGHDSDERKLFSTYLSNKTNYIVSLDFVDRINRKIAQGSKKVKMIIENQKENFHDLYSNIKHIEVMGFSFNNIDMPYIKAIIEANKNAADIDWTIYFHSKGEDNVFIRKLLRIGINCSKINAPINW